MTKLKAPDGVRSLSVGGIEYTTDKGGLIELEGDELIQIAIANGFTNAPAPKPTAKATDAAKAGD